MTFMDIITAYIKQTVKIHRGSSACCGTRPEFFISDVVICAAVNNICRVLFKFYKMEVKHYFTEKRNNLRLMISDDGFMFFCFLSSEKEI